MTCHCKTKFLINESQVPLAQRSNSDYQVKRNALESTLSESDFEAKACIHEAGHLIFFARMGVSEFHYVVPYMEITDAGYDYTLAAVRPKSQNVDISSELMLSEMALAATAGGVFLRELRKQTDGRDSDDMDRFFRHCIRLGFNNTKKDLWEEGRKAVEDELACKAELAQRAEQVAQYLRPLLFLQILPSPKPGSQA